jgi:hypothetical protein
MARCERFFGKECESDGNLPLQELRAFHFLLCAEACTGVAGAGGSLRALSATFGDNLGF